MNKVEKLIVNALKEHFAPYLDELCSDCKNRFETNPLRILDCKVDRDHPSMKNAPKTIDYLSETAKEHFNKVCELLDDLEIEYVIRYKFSKRIRLLLSHCL